MSPKMGKTPLKRGLSTETHDRGGSFWWVLPAGLKGGKSGAIC